MKATDPTARIAAYPAPLRPARTPRLRLSSPVLPTSANPTSTPPPTAVAALKSVQDLPQVWPAGIVRPSPLVVDSSRGRVYTSDVRGAAQRPSGAKAEVDLSTYDADTGRRVRTQPLSPGDVLLDVGESGELFVLSATGADILETGWEVRVLDRQGDQERRFAIPTPAWSDPAFEPRAFSLKPALPLVDRGRSQILAFSGPRVTVFDSETGEVTREFEVPPAGTHGSVVRAALDESGETLYLAMADPGLGDWEGSPGVRLMALDWQDLEILDQSELRAQLGAWVPTGDGMIVSGYSYKQRGMDQRLWKKGREVARRTGAWTEWSAYDQKRWRALGSTGFQSDDYHLVVTDRQSIDISQLPAYPATLAGQGSLTAYDPETDQFFGRGLDPDRLVALPAATLVADQPERLSDLQAAVVTPSTFAFAGERRGPPQFLTGHFIRPPRLGEPTPDPDNAKYVHAFSTDGGETWRTAGEGARTVTGWPEGVTASPGFESDRTLFGYRPGFGVFRSTDSGVSWEPTSDGLGALFVREVVLSPDYSWDGTLMAVAENDYREDVDLASAWISRNRGQSWSDMGSFTTVAFSPDYARDNRILAFDGGRFHESFDGGTSWRHGGVLTGTWRGGDIAGRLWVIPATTGRPEVLLTLTTNSSEMGGMAHWDEAGAYVFHSTDGGNTWATGSSGGLRYGLTGELIGPVGDDVPPAWVVQIEGWPTWAMLSRDGGISWSEVTLKDQPEALIVAETEEGELLVWDPKRGMSTIGLDALDPVPTATPRS